MVAVTTPGAVIRTEDSINLRDSTELDVFPDLIAAGSVVLSGCTAVRNFSHTLLADGYVEAAGCVSLTRLASRFSAGLHLDLEGCVELRQLPTGLQVGDFLDLTGCRSLRQLPSELVVLDWIKLLDSGIQVIPRDADIADHELLIGHEQIILVPDESWSAQPYAEPEDRLRVLSGTVVDGSKLHAELYDRLAEDPDLCQLALQSVFFRNQIKDGDLDFELLLKLQQASLQPSAKPTVL